MNKEPSELEKQRAAVARRFADQNKPADLSVSAAPERKASKKAPVEVAKPKAVRQQKASPSKEATRSDKQPLQVWLTATEMREFKIASAVEGVSPSAFAVELILRELSDRRGK